MKQAIDQKLKESSFVVTGMTCGSCVRHVKEALHSLPGVSEVNIKLETNSVSIRHDSEFVSTAQLALAVEGAGYLAKERV